MAERRKNQTQPVRSQRPPAFTPEEYEDRLKLKAYNLAESQLDDGTASAQVITHFLKAASTREYLEQERLKMEVELMEAKKEQLASEARVEELYSVAIQAMRTYSGHQSPELEERYDD